MKRHVFLDLDGTVLNHFQQVPESAREAITAAVARGHQLYMCTGRSPAEIYPFLWDLGFVGLISSNGAYVELGGKELLRQEIDPADVAEINDWLEEAGAIFHWTGDAIYANEGFRARFSPDAGDGSQLPGDWSTFLEQVAPHLKSGLPKWATKVTFTLPAGGPTLADVQAKFGDRCTIVSGSLSPGEAESGELTAKGVDKADGLRRLADHLGVPLEETILIGDSANDVEALRIAGTSVAMGNAIDEVKEVADFVTTGVDDDGLANAFTRLGLLAD